MKQIKSQEREQRNHKYKLMGAMKNMYDEAIQQGIRKRVKDKTDQYDFERGLLKTDHYSTFQFENKQNKLSFQNRNSPKEQYEQAIQRKMEERVKEMEEEQQYLKKQINSNTGHFLDKLESNS
mmetsp:Transcript_25310/g.22430  ORF Transcript_25310/g.22430 Transcript_25310/m.22430 type:complete len:123 (-) Transcript_25310:421-789(-)